MSHSCCWSPSGGPSETGAPGVSELFCPATIALAWLSISGDEPTAAGQLTRQIRRLVERLSGQRVAAVWCIDCSGGLAAAESVAALLGLSGIQFHSGADGATDGDDADPTIGRLSVELRTAADQFRGETVLIVSQRDAVEQAVAELCTNAAEVRNWDPSSAGLAWVTADADGWQLSRSHDLV